MQKGRPNKQLLFCSCVIGLIWFFFETSCHCYLLRLRCKSYANFSIKATGHLLEGSLIQEIYGIDLNECKLHCVLNQQCKSINIKYDGSGLCQLNNKSSHDMKDKVNLTNNNDWEFYTTNYSVRAVGQNCMAANKCRQNEICLDTCGCPGYECIRCGMLNRGIHCNRCISNPCQNGGRCRHFGGSICDCKPGYNGTFCENDPCLSNSCQNGGYCTVTASGPQCTCPSGYTGNICETAEYSDDQWQTGCYYEGVINLETEFTSKTNCFTLCKDNLYTAAFINTVTTKCVCTISTNQVPMGDRLCIEIKQDLFFLPKCLFTSSKILNSGSPYSRRGCYNACVNQGYISASLHVDKDCYCSNEESTTPNTVHDCISKNRFSL
ncbi:neurogenic locus notch homolog protein 1-like [Rhopilema esculentum]|uniref:neurogenic locus notch homolog protein 1-like n=1 Tax=Rhopilema esculentum TaxID=499914 RepID=UPI0031D04039